MGIWRSSRITMDLQTLGGNSRFGGQSHIHVEFPPPETPPSLDITHKSPRISQARVATLRQPLDSIHWDGHWDYNPIRTDPPSPFGVGAISIFLLVSMLTQLC